MHNLVRRTAAVLAFAAAAAPLSAQQTPQPPAGPALTLEQALSTARERNPEMLQQRNDLRSSRAAVRAARFDFLPSVDVDAGFGYQAPGEQRVGAFQLQQTSPAYYSSYYGLGFTYRLDGAKLMQPAIARATHTATAERIEGYEAGLVSQVAQQYVSALQALEQAEQALREVERTREHERLARARLEVGAGTPLDLRRAEVQVGQAEVAVVQRRATYRTELLRLGRLMGAPLPAGTRLTSSFTLFEPAWTAETLVEMALTGNPDLDAARASARAARTQVRASRSQYLPSMVMSVDFGGSVYSASSIDGQLDNILEDLPGTFASCQRDNQLNALIGAPPRNCEQFNPANPEVTQGVRERLESQNPAFPFGFRSQPMTARLGLSLPVFNGLSRERRIEEARVAAQDAELQVQSRELQLRTEIEAALLSLHAAYQVAELQEQVVQRASEELRLAQERFRFGVASSVEVTDAQTSLAEAERARIDAVYNYHKSLAALEALVGRPLR